MGDRQRTTRAAEVRERIETIARGMTVAGHRRTRFESAWWQWSRRPSVGRQAARTATGVGW